MNRPPDAVIEDRQSAIKFAIDSAGTEDVVLIAGKGHENRQLISDQELPFNDREVVETMLGASRC
jgi:UDP-N-acetylmuramoyl-L-alanyl-D-glutamate--2,6-diaminopimelate ligase